MTDVAISARNVSKCYQIYESPRDRLKQSIIPRAKRFFTDDVPDKYYREFWALDDVSFDILKGETVGVIGRNGSGKSTLLQIISGTLTPTSGDVRAVGRVAALLELGSGFNPEFTGRENVLLYGSILGLSQEQVDARYEQIAAFADIGEFIDQPIKTYSSGMVLRLAFAVIAHVDAEVLIIDEALSVGDAFFTQKCMRFLREFQARGTLLFVSHDPSAVVALCSRAVWLDQGRLVMSGTAQHVTETYLAQQHANSRLEASGENVVISAQVGRSAAVAPDQDVRHDLRKALGGSGQIQFFEFEPDRAGIEYGARQASIGDARFTDDGGNTVQILSGGEMVALKFSVTATRDLQGLIFGFYVKNRLGQRLFGDNTYLAYMQEPIDMTKGDRVEVAFGFRMPMLPGGSYMVDIAVASGTQEDHTQQHWIHDALEFHATDSSMRGGLVGIPMHSIVVSRF